MAGNFQWAAIASKKAGDAGLVDAVKAKQRQAEREKRFQQREAERKASLDAQRKRNGGLTDWELQEQQWKIQQQEEQARKRRRGQAIQPIVQPIIDALAAKPTPFTIEMAALLAGGEIPEGRALDICRAIYGEAFAKTTTGKTRGIHFKAVKGTGREQAAQWFAKAKATLANFTSE